MAALAAMALGGCGGGSLSLSDASDGGSADAAEGVDAAGEVWWLHLRWTIFYEGRPSTCADVGVVRVALQDTQKVTHSTFACDEGEATLGPFTFAQLDSFVLDSYELAGLDASEVAFTKTRLDPDPPTRPGAYELPVAVLQVTDEPIPEMRRIFQAATAWYRAHGTLPSAAGPAPAWGSCCGQIHDLCDPVWTANQFWNLPPWTDLGFQLGFVFLYSYSFTPHGTSFTIAAGADLDCDGRLSHYEIDGALTAAGDFAGIDNVMITMPDD
jgi:hypothetical protein